MADVAYEAITAKVNKHKAEVESQKVKDSFRTRQRDLASKTWNKRVHDIVDLEDNYGDNVFLWIFAEPDRTEVKEGEVVIVMMVFMEQDRQGILFEEATVKKGKYYHGSELIVTKVVNGAFSY
jgi:hypothetical protein